MVSASLELQGAIVSTLREATSVTALVGQKIYDVAPMDAQPPYVAMGDFDEHRSDATCLDARKIYVTLHAWSSSPGFMEVRQVAETIAETLHHAPLSLVTNRLVSLDHSRTRVMRDLDGIHSHAVIELVAYTEKL